MVALHHGSCLYQMNIIRTGIYAIFRSFRLNTVSHWWTVYATKTRPRAGDLPHILRQHKGPSHLCPPLSTAGPRAVPTKAHDPRGPRSSPHTFQPEKPGPAVSRPSTQVDLKGNTLAFFIFSPKRTAVRLQGMLKPLCPLLLLFTRTAPGLWSWTPQICRTAGLRTILRPGMDSFRQW